MKDMRVEQWLTSESVRFTYEADMPIEDIDIEASKQNQARVNAPIIEDLVERYTLAYIDGANLPALLGYRRDKDNRIVLLDGNQRHGRLEKDCIAGTTPLVGRNRYRLAGP